MVVTSSSLFSWGMLIAGQPRLWRRRADRRSPRRRERVSRSRSRPSGGREPRTYNPPNPRGARRKRRIAPRAVVSEGERGAQAAEVDQLSSHHDIADGAAGRAC